MPLRDVHADDKALAAVSLRPLRRGALILFVGILLLAAVALALGWRNQVSLESLIRHRAVIAALVANHPLSALTGYVAFYAVAAGLSLPGVIFLTIGGGVFFGGLLGGAAAVIAATLGATAAFLLAKSVLRRLAMRWLGPQVARFAAGFRADAFGYLLFLRLLPVFPFSLGNLLPALCGVSLRTFVTATVLGITPMTLAIAFFGAGIDSVLAIEIARFQSCLTAQGANCRLGFEIWMAVTPQFIGGLLAFAVAIVLPVVLRRARIARR